MLGLQRVALEEDDLGVRLAPVAVVLLRLAAGLKVGAILALAENDPDLAAPLVPGLPYLRAEAIFAVRNEMARTIDDILSRRTRARLLARDDSAVAAPSVAALIGPELGWDDAEQSRQVAEYVRQIAEERTAPGLPEVLLDTAMTS